MTMDTEPGRSLCTMLAITALLLMALGILG